MTTPAQPPSNPVKVPPSRRPGSIRRTSTVLMHWPGGPRSALHLEGRARDLVTRIEGDPFVAAEGSMAVVVGRDRVVEAISVTPEHPSIAGIVGAKGGGGMRQAIEASAASEKHAGTPLYLLLDEIPSATLIANFAWSRWRLLPFGPKPDKDPAGQAGVSVGGTARPEVPNLAELRAAVALRKVEGICAGFRPGSSALTDAGVLNLERGQNVAAAPPLVDADDPEGWHAIDPHPPMAMRRARRIDVWCEGAELRIDAMFRDSSWDPDGSEIVVHEYRIEGVADTASGVLTSVSTEPRVLPYAECPSAAANASRMLGVPLCDLRREVLERLRGTDCCTHLNDALRALAEVPVLAGAL